MLVFMVVVTTIFAQESESISLITYWEKGDVFKYEKIKGKKRYKNEVLEDSTAEKSIFKLTVVEATKEDYLIEVSTESGDMEVWNELEETGIDGGEILLLLMKYKEMKIRYRIDSLGAFLGIDKPEVINNFSNEFSKIILAALEKSQGEIAPESRALVEKVTSPNVMMSKIFLDIQLMHYFFGADWYLDTLVHYQDELPNLTGGAPIPVEGELSFQWYDEDVVHVVQRNFVSEENFTNFLQMTLGDVMKDEKVSGKLTDVNQIFIEPATGIIHAFFRDRYIDIQPDLSTVEFTEILLID